MKLTFLNSLFMGSVIASEVLLVMKLFSLAFNVETAFLKNALSPFAVSRSSHQRCSIKKGVIENFAKFTGKHLYQSLFFKKVAGHRHATLLKKRLWHSCFPRNSVKFSRTPPDDCFLYQ